MSLETYTYFIIILGGFGLVWGYRKGIGSHKNISDFEYLGFSAFWGVIVIGCWEWLYRKNSSSFNETLKNPYIAGASLFILSVLIGYGIGAALWKIRLKLS